MKTIITTLIILLSGFAYAEDCTKSLNVSSQNVEHKVDTSTPEHLKGAKITVTLADGRTSTVPAEKFMVVPRKQLTVVGQDKTVSEKLVCKSSNKNLLMGEVRKDVTEIEATTTGATTRVESKRELVPGVNYFRRELFDSRIGAGVGVDSNGTVKGLLGVEF